MGKVPVDLRKNIATNIKNCRNSRFPMWGGSKKCAEDFGVSPQQWSQWERGTHMPDEFRMMEIADFFGVSTAFLRRDNAHAKKEGTRHWPYTEVRAVRLVDGKEVPLRVEVERMVYTSKYEVQVERIL